MKQLTHDTGWINTLTNAISKYDQWKMFIFYSCFLTPLEYIPCMMGSCSSFKIKWTGLIFLLAHSLEGHTHTHFTSPNITYFKGWNLSNDNSEANNIRHDSSSEGFTSERSNFAFPLQCLDGKLEDWIITWQMRAALVSLLETFCPISFKQEETRVKCVMMACLPFKINGLCKGKITKHN